MNKTTDIKLNKVVSVYDGDTFRGIVNAWPDWVNDNEKGARFRIAYIDTPEIRGSVPHIKDLGEKAKNLVVTKLEEAKDIRFDIIDPSYDKYGRILVKLRADGEDIAEMLMAEGLAYPYDGKTKQEW